MANIVPPAAKGTAPAYFTDLNTLSTKIQRLMVTPGGSLTSAINAALRSGGLDVKSTRRLLFFQDLTSNDVLQKFLVERYGNAEPSLAQIALSHYFDGLPGLENSDTDVVNLRAKLWEKEPLAVLLAAFRKVNLLSTTLVPFKPFIEKALNAAVERKLPLLSPEFRSLVQAKGFIPENTGEAGNKITPDQIYNIITAIQRLHCLVTRPEHLEALLARDMRSAHDVAKMQRGIFLSMMDEASKVFKEKSQESFKMSQSEASRIHDHATTIDCRNQETWARILDSLKPDFNLILPIPGQSIKSDAKSQLEQTKKGTDQPPQQFDGKDLLAHKNYNMSTIFDLQTSSCEECSSVIGPGAYLVDLLNFLKASPCTSTTKEITFTTLFDALNVRRPDLQDLELSCANSKNMLPYIALVNEALASFIASMNESGADEKAVGRVKAYNEAVEKAVTSPSPLQDTSVFAHENIEKLMFPLNVFPYNQGSSAVNIYLNAMGVTNYEVLTAFRSEARILQSFEGSVLPADTSSRQTLLEEAGNVSRRAAVAESLNLQPGHVAAIAEETLYTPRFLTHIMALRPEAGDLLTRRSGIPKVHSSWGYDNVGEMTSTDESKATGLCFVRSQFMPRSGMSFEEVLELLRSLFFGARLILTNVDKTSRFTGQISEMRLQALDTTAEAPIQKTVGPLTELLCHEMQAFIRLRHRLGWSITQLDTALSALLENHVATGAISSVTGARRISFRLLEDLSRVRKLAELVDMPVDSILPLWASIGTHGNGSLYDRVFLGPATVLSGDDIFKSLDTRKDANGNLPARRDEPISKHFPALMTALRRSQDEIISLLSASGISSTSVKLDMHVVTKLYRHSTMCRMLRATPTEYLAIQALLPPGTDPFQDPATTLSCVEDWVQLLNRGWTMKETILTVSPTSVAVPAMGNDKATLSALNLATTIIGGLDAMESLWEPRVRDQVVRSDDLAQVCGELYDTITAATVAAFVEGTQTTDAAVPLTNNLASVLKGIKKLPQTLSLSVAPGSAKNSGYVTLTVTGLLSAEIRDAVLLGETREDVKKGLRDLLDELSTRSRAGYKALSDRLFGALSTNECNELKTLFGADVRDGTATLTGDQAVLKVETTLKLRRKAFISAAIPTLRAQNIEANVVRAIGDEVSGLEAPILSMLATESLVQDAASVLDTVRDACLGFISVNLSVADIKSAFFVPAASNTYQFRLMDRVNTDANTAPSLSINGISLRLTRSPENDSWQSDPLQLSTGQPYKLISTVSLNQGRWVDKQSSRPLKFSKLNLVPVEVVESTSTALSSISRFGQLIKRLDLGLEEFKFLTSSAETIVKMGLSKPSIEGLRALELYRDLRDSVGNDRDAIVTLFAWLRNPTSSGKALSLSDLSSRLAKATLWPKTQLDIFLELKYPGLSAKEVTSCFAASLEELSALRAAMELSSRLSSAPGKRTAEPLLVLFQTATPRQPTKKEKDLDTAAALQLYLGPGQLAQCNRDIRETQRTVLVQFLLQQKYIQKYGIVDADGLFSYFMLDVQMGAQLEITRMKAAISTIQLFVQRVMLGLEVSFGVKEATIDKEKWAWLQRHNIWQATRKAFLYPENWIEPSLRDDKTPLFEAYETAVMSKDLSWETFSQSMRSYVQTLLSIADLDVAAYLREARPGDVEIYHFFGRTRSAPFDLYYRSLRIARSGAGKDLGFWSPWRKIGIEAQTYEADWNGQSLLQGGCYLIPVVRNKRLFLYLPQIMARGLVPSSDQPIETMVKSTPSKIMGPTTWEVRMGWTELVDDQWTPKRVLQTPLVVDWIDKMNLPSIDKFVFNTATSGPNVIISVGCTRLPNGEFYRLGQFDVNDERIVPSKHDKQNTPLGTVMNTSFHKYTWTAKADTVGPKNELLLLPAVSTYSLVTKSVETPLLAISRRDYERTLTWTMSYANASNNTNKATGLVVDEQTGGANGTTMFMYPRDESVDATLGTNTLYLTSKLEPIEHAASREMMEAVSQSQDGLAALFDTMDRKLVLNTDYGKAVVRSDMSNFHELATSYAIYNWELGLHAVLLAVDRFHTTQQYDNALKAARLVFDPTTTPSSTLSAAQKAAACWKFRPFRDLAESKADMADKFVGWPKDGSLEIAVSERRSNPSTVHSTARGRPQAYMKWIVMKYIEILVDAGDDYFRQGSMETLPLAIQRYTEAAHVLGPDPPKVPQLAKAIARSYRQVNDPAIQVDLELAFPFLCDIERRGSKRADGDSRDRTELLCILTTTYFRAPPNPKYASLRTLVQDRLYKARNNLDINGRPITYSMAEPYIDPGQAMRALQGGAGAIGSLMNDADSPMPFQRFSFLISKALELCNEVRSMGEQFLSIREKQDAEALTLLKARQDTARQKILIDLKTLQADEITKTIESLFQNRDAAVAQLQYYLRLTGDSFGAIPIGEDDRWEDIAQNIDRPTSDDLRMSPLEKAELASAASASVLNVAAAGMDTLAGILKAFPNVTSNVSPIGCGASIKMDASNIAQITKSVSMATKCYAMVASETGNMLSRVSGLTKQLQERRLQANMKGREIKNIDKQIEIQRKRLEINAKEFTIQKSEIDAAVETEAFYRTKYTNDKLYAWMEGSVRTIHHDLYILAADMCRRAERAFKFERGSHISTSFLRTGGYWDSSRDGLLAAQQLALDLRRMEAAYLQKPLHDFELSKNISLRKLDPLALLTLRETGSTNFALPESLFDMDFPGHYMRRIKTVSLSIPSVVGPFATLAATLSLVQQSYRVSAAPSAAEAYLSATPSDGSFRTDPIPITAVATSSGVQDPGTFELSFNPSSSAYAPFEGAGAISSWNLVLPPMSFAPFDYSTISDVVLHVRYTAVDGGPLLRRAAAGAVKTLAERKTDLAEKEGFWGFVEVKNELGAEWSAFRSALKRTESQRVAELDVGGAMKGRLPFWARTDNGSEVVIESLTVVVSWTSAEDKNLGRDLSIPALGTTGWDKTTLGNRVLLNKSGLGEVVKLNDPSDKEGKNWRLKISKPKGEACEIGDLAVFFRFALVQGRKS